MFPGARPSDDLRRHGVRLGDLLALQALAFQHVHEIGVAAEVELVGAVDAHAAILEQPGQHPMGDGGAHLALDVVADDGQPGFLEAPAPGRVLGDEHRDAVDEAGPGRQRLLGVIARPCLAAHRQVVDQHVGARVAAAPGPRPPARPATR